jgi:hypothetical protein
VPASLGCASADNPVKKRRQITVFDATDRKVFNTAIDNVALERDFNGVEIDGLAPSGCGVRRRPRRSIRLDVCVAPCSVSPERSSRSALSRRMSAAKHSGSGVETTSAKAVRNPPASVSGNSIRSSVQGFVERIIPRPQRGEETIASMLVLIWIHVHWLLCATVLVARRYQMIGIGCCPRAASGHAAAAPPSSVMNSRRLIRSPRRRAAGDAMAPRGREPWRS